MHDSADKFDVILFCHSLYGMKHKCRLIKRALGMLIERSRGRVVIVFHRDETLRLDGITCHQTASFPTGVIRVADDDEVLNRSAPFVAGFVMQDESADKTIEIERRKVCRALGRREEAQQDHILFSSPNMMV
ncbi:hypothetical protein E5D57_013246 [Metarhizium anisopliae]|nr:hypothetical protein E5D57_013246 [Metarhizium anisopliae]